MEPIRVLFVIVLREAQSTEEHGHLTAHHIAYCRRNPQANGSGEVHNGLTEKPVPGVARHFIFHRDEEDFLGKNILEINQKMF